MAASRTDPSGPSAWRSGRMVRLPLLLLLIPYLEIPYCYTLYCTNIHGDSTAAAWSCPSGNVVDRPLAPHKAATP